jgi:hypothetical protein
LVAGDLFADEHEVNAVWEHALAEVWLKPAGHDLAYDERFSGSRSLAGWLLARAPQGSRRVLRQGISADPLPEGPLARPIDLLAGSRLTGS